MGTKRNGLLEIYRLLFCFWVMYHHNFFFIEKGSTFTVAHLAVDFFFILSGMFLRRSMKRRSEEKTIVGMTGLVGDRIKPILFPLCFVAAFNMICIALFVREDVLKTMFNVFCYWWYILYLAIAVALFYLLYRAVKNEKIFAAILALICIAMCTLHYFTEEHDFFISELTFVYRAFACLSFGMLISYLPTLKKKAVAVAIIIVAILIGVLLYLAWGDKNYLICLTIVLLFAPLVYFTSTIEVGGKVFDLIGKLSTRMYIYMAFVSMLRVLGLTNHRVLFVVDLALAVLSVTLDEYRRKYKKLKDEKK